ncbi:MAG: glutamine--fructose-6-phosphate transaminase (isomerizing) [Nanoarchaeota archaeon]
MCGIFGYLGGKVAEPILVEGLKALEYRGYDSWGIALQAKPFRLIRRVGRISQVRPSPHATERIGIGHTRWATHGRVTEQNAHPHLSSGGTIAIVHNGIIENFSALKAALTEEGFHFSSETDSEVIANLVEKYYAGNLEKAVLRALRHVEGAYGLLVMHVDEKKLVAARNGSPLMIGLGKDEFFVASDASPLVAHTKRVVYLDDGNVAVITKAGYRIVNLHNRQLDKQVDEITWTIEAIERHGYEHFMLKEIMEQPESFMNVLRGRITGSRVSFGGLNLPEGFLGRLSRIVITACGTSWHAALVGEYLIEEIARIPVEVEYASEFRYRNPLVGEDDLVIVISQSGETADTLAALREARARKAKTFGIVNVVGSTIAREARGGIYLHAGPEIGVASTKAFTSQVGALYLFAVLLAQEKGTRTKEEIKKLLEELEEVPQSMRAALKKSDGIRTIAEHYAHNHNFLYLGRGVNFPVALEGALKMKEISYIHAEGYPAAEMKHGPIALIDDLMPAVFVAPTNGAFKKILSNMQEVKARGGRIIAIASEKSKDLEHLADHVILIPKAKESIQPLLAVIPLQLLAYHIANIRGCDIDKPRNLAKSVTVE